MVAIILRGRVMRVALVEGGVRGRPVHHLLAFHHVTHGGFRTVRAAGAGVGEHCGVEDWTVNSAGWWLFWWGR